MKHIIIFLAILIVTILFTSCTTQQRVVYRDCDCNTTTFGLGWNTNPYWGWNDPLWGWNRWNWYPYRVIPRYYIPNRVQPSQPTRYERKQSVGARPSRIIQNQPQRYEKRVTTPQIQRNTQTNRYDNVYPQRSQPSRVQNNQPNRVQTPSRVQQRVNTPISTQPTRSRVQNREN